MFYVTVSFSWSSFHLILSLPGPLLLAQLIYLLCCLAVFTLNITGCPYFSVAAFFGLFNWVGIFLKYLPLPLSLKAERGGGGDGRWLFGN